MAVLPVAALAALGLLAACDGVRLVAPPGYDAGKHDARCADGASDTASAPRDLVGERAAADLPPSDTEPPCSGPEDCVARLAPGPCERAACDEASGRCTLVGEPDGVSCDDGDRCTSDDRCAGGRCAGTALLCAFEDDCIPRRCSPETGTCVAAPLPDGSPCDSAGEGPCAAGECRAGLCVAAPLPDGALCDDRDACTDDERCFGGRCEGEARVCESSEPCAPMSCDVETGDCVANPLPDGSACGTVTEDGCHGSLCYGGVCGALQALADGTACDDGDRCTTDDRCGDGRCGGTPVVCDDGVYCTVDACVPSTGDCVFDPVPRQGSGCDDGDLCTTNDRCARGDCAGEPVEECCLRSEDCEDGDPCTEELCGLDHRCKRWAVLCAAETEGCWGGRCLADGSCAERELVRPALLWERSGLRAEEPAGLRPWPAGSWELEDGAGRRGAGAWRIEPGEAGALSLPPVFLPPGTVTLELALREEGGLCPVDSGLTLELGAEGEALASVPCFSDTDWHTVTVAVGRAEGGELRARLEHAAGRGLQLDELRLVHRGWNGCPLGTPRTLEGSENATHLALAAGPDEAATIAWADNTTTVLYAEPLGAGEGPPEAIPLTELFTPSSLFGLGLARDGGAAAVCWGRVDGPADSQALLLDDGVVSPPPFALRAPEAEISVTPRVAAVGDGSWQFVWAARWTGSPEFRVVVQRFSASGEALTEVLELAADGKDPDLARLADGRFAVVYGRGDAVAMGSLDASGRPEQELVTLSDLLPGERGSFASPRVAALADGRAVVVWEQQTNRTQGADVFYRLVTPGVPDTEHPPPPLADVTTNNQRSPVVLGLPEGGFWAAWTSDDVVANNPVIRFAGFGESPPSASRQVFPGSTLVNMEKPEAVLSRDGRVYVAWVDGNHPSISYTTLPLLCTEGWWRCEGEEVAVCTPGGYLPLLGSCADCGGELLTCP